MWSEYLGLLPIDIDSVIWKIYYIYILPNGLFLFSDIGMEVNAVNLLSKGCLLTLLVSAIRYKIQIQ